MEEQVISCLTPRKRHVGFFKLNIHALPNQEDVFVTSLMHSINPTVLFGRGNSKRV